MGPNQTLYFLEDNARPQTAQQSISKIEEIGLTLKPHPPYSLDLSQSDHYLFSPLKNAIRGNVYNDIETAIINSLFPDRTYFPIKESEALVAIEVYFYKISV